MGHLWEQSYRISVPVYRNSTALASLVRFIGYVLFGGAASWQENRMAFACIEEARRGTFTVPEFILKAMPAAPAERGYLFLAQHPLDTRFTAPGLDLGYFQEGPLDGAGRKRLP